MDGAGDYILRIGDSSTKTAPVAVLRLDGEVVSEQCAPVCPRKREEPYRKADLPERLQKLSESLTTEELATLVCGGGTRGERLVTAMGASGTTTSKLYEPHGILNVILPGRPDQVEAIVAGVESGEALLSDLKRSAGRVLRLIAENTVVSL